MRETWSPGLGPVLTWITMLLMLALDAVILYLYGELLQTFFYPATLTWVTVVTMGALAVWMAVRSLAVVARNVQFWFPLILASFILVRPVFRRHALSGRGHPHSGRARGVTGSGIGGD